MKILHRYTQAVIFEADAESFRELVFKAIQNDANLRDAYLRGASLHRADLEGANLRDANLRDAGLHRANLSGAELEGTDLRGASLHGANLRDAKLSGVNRRLTVINGSVHTLIAHDQGIQVGCKIKELGWWTNSAIAKLGASEGYTQEQIAEYKKYICFAKGLYLVEAKDSTKL